MIRLVPGRRIRYSRLGDLTVIMDLSTGHYFLLDETATAMWDIVLDAGSGANAVDLLLDRFHVDAELLRADLEEFVRTNLARGFIENESPEREIRSVPRLARRTSRWFLTLRAWWALLTTVAGLKAFGFGKWYERMDRLPRNAASRDLPDLDIARAESAFLRAENFFVLRNAPNDCLPRSLSLFQFLTRIGLPAQHCIGVHRIPISMHAWVECGGRVVMDRQDCQSITVVARLDE